MIGVVGATSRLGGLVLRGLRERGAEALALVRSPERAPPGPTRRCDLVRPETLQPAVEGLDVVVSVAGASLAPWPVWPRQSFRTVDAGGHAALAEACATEGVQRVVYVSVFGDESMEALRYVRFHREAEVSLRAEVPEVVVARPTGLFGAFDQLVPLAKRGVALQAGRPEARTNPLSERDLADRLVAAALREVEPGTVDIGGPDVLTSGAIWDLALAAHGQRGLRLPAPNLGLWASAAAMWPVDRRAADVLRFVQHILNHDCVAPQLGTHTLADYWSQAPLNGGGSPAP